MVGSNRYPITVYSNTRSANTRSIESVTHVRGIIPTIRCTIPGIPWKNISTILLRKRCSKARNATPTPCTSNMTMLPMGLDRTSDNYMQHMHPKCRYHRCFSEFCKCTYVHVLTIRMYCRMLSSHTGKITDAECHVVIWVRFFLQSTASVAMHRDWCVVLVAKVAWGNIDGQQRQSAPSARRKEVVANDGGTWIEQHTETSHNERLLRCYCYFVANTEGSFLIKV